MREILINRLLQHAFCNATREELDAMRDDELLDEYERCSFELCDDGWL